MSDTATPPIVTGHQYFSPYPENSLPIPEQIHLSPSFVDMVRTASRDRRVVAPHARTAAWAERVREVVAEQEVSG